MNGIDEVKNQQQAPNIWRRMVAGASATALTAAAIVGAPFETPFDALDTPLALAEGNPTPLPVPVFCTDDITAINGQNLLRINTTTGAATTVFTSTQDTGLDKNGLASNTDDAHIYWGSGTRVYYYDAITGAEGVFGDFDGTNGEIALNGTLESGGAAYFGGYYYFGVEIPAGGAQNTQGLYRVQVDPTDPTTFVAGTLQQLAADQPADGLTAANGGTTEEADYGDISVTTNGSGEVVIYGSTASRPTNVSGDFWSYNVDTSAFTIIGDPYNTFRAYQLSVDISGDMFGLNGPTGELVSINPTTGVHTTIVTTGASNISDTAGAFCAATPTRLNLEKTSALTTDADGSGDVTAGDTITYTFTSTNIGNALITGVSISDPLPGLSALSCTPAQPVDLVRGEQLVCTATLTVTQAHVDAGSIENTATTTGTAGGVTISDTGTDTVPLLSIDFTKTVSPTGPVDLGDTLTYTLTTTNPSGLPITGVTVSDPVPTGSSYVAASGSVSGPIAFEDWSSNGYADGQGWVGNWIEVNDLNGPAVAATAVAGTCGPNNDDVCVLVDSVSNSEVLRVENENNGIYRQIDLTTATSADLVYDFRRTQLVGTADFVAVYARATAPTNANRGAVLFTHEGGPGTLIGTITDGAFNSNTVSLDAFVGAPVFISMFGRNGGDMDQANGVNFDNVRVDAVRDPSDPPALTTTPVLPPGTSATYTFQVTVDNPRPSGLDSIDNTATANSDQTSEAQASTSNPLPPVADISGSVFDDTEQDETISAGDTPIDAVVIQLFEDADGNGVAEGPAIATTTTLPDGTYVFTDVGAGTYLVVETDPAGLASVSDTDGGNDNTITVTLDGTSTDSTGNDFLDTGIDFGDGPASYGSASAVTNSELFLGAGVTRDAGDRYDDGDVDNGVDLSSLTLNANGTWTVEVATTNATGSTAALAGWIDFNADGDFDDPGERASAVVPVNGGPVTLTFTPVGTVSQNQTYARFRIAADANDVSAPIGLAAQGEVEDYLITAGTLPVTLASFDSSAKGSKVTATWWSGTEAANAGYILYGEATNTSLVALTELLPGAGDSLTPLEYSTTVKTEMAVLWLADVDVEGVETLHGPFTVGETTGTVPVIEETEWAEVEVEVTESAEAVESELSAAQGTTPGRQTRRGAPAVAALSVDQAGLYRVTFEDLMAAGQDWSGVQFGRLAVIDSAGEPVPYMKDGRQFFSDGESITFWADEVDTLYSGTNVYRLVEDRSLREPLQRTRGSRRGASPVSTTETVSFEEQVSYSTTMPGDDPWYWARVLAFGSPRSFNATVELDAVAEGEASVTVGVVGGFDFPTADDHHVEVSVNGVAVGDVRFDGMNAATITGMIPSGTLVSGANTVTMTVVGDNGQSFDKVLLDSVDVTYQRALVAVDGSAIVDVASKRVDVTGFDSLDVTVVRLDEPGKVPAVRFVAADGTVTVRFAGDTRGGRYAVYTDSAMLTPDISVARPANDLLDGSSDLLIVTHGLFADGLGDLVAVREAQGLAVKVVDIADVYAAYSGGVVDAASITSYLVDAAGAFGDPAVLLVGSDSYDYRDYTGVGSVSFIPTIYGDVGVGPVKWSPVDPALVDFDGDSVPDLALGRFPVRTEAELANAIAKTLAHQPGDSAVFAAEDGYGAAAEEIAASLPDGIQVERAFLDDVDLATARSTVIDGLDGGTDLAVYFGHSSVSQWAADGLFAADDAEGLTNAADPNVIVQFGCWNTYFSDPTAHSLGSTLSTANGGGAAVLGATTLTSAHNDLAFGPILIGRMATSTSVGEAMLNAKHDLAANTAAPDITLGWTLLGDPTLKIGW